MRAMKDSGVEWIGEIPQDWGIIKSKYILSANDGGVWGDEPKNEGDDKVVIRSTEQTVDGKWCIVTPAKRDLSKEKLYSRILCGDLLITKSSGSEFHIGKTTIAGEYFIDHECYHSNFLQRIRCSIIYKSRFLWYLLNSNIVREQFVYLQNSTSGIGNINADNIKNIILPYPDKLLQQKMVDYLDSKCSKIDAIIEKQQAVIEKLKEYKLSVITEAVTKGLNPDVGMKDSGVEWIGEVPKHWDVSTMKRYCRVNQGLQIAQDDRFFESGENRYVYITVKYLNSNKKDVAEYIHNPPINTICNKDDLLMARTGATGNLVTNIEGCFHNNFFKINYNKAFFVKDFLVYYFLQDTIKSYLHLLAGTTTIPDLNHDDFYTTPILLPPLLEQETIVKFLNVKCNFIEDVIKKKKKVIEKFTEYKKSLIYEIVTGKKEV